MDDDDVCLICAENVKYYGLGICNHRTCHLCALRLRALYKETRCTFCKTASESVIFTARPDRGFNDYGAADTPYVDEKLKARFERAEDKDEILGYLRFNCPEEDCSTEAGRNLDGWTGLKRHVTKAHGKLLCDLCIKNKKIFPHEHTLYTQHELTQHYRYGEGPGSSREDTGFRGHPECGFCRKAYYGDDELYDHCKRDHEQCFICVRHGGEGRFQYFKDYQQLEKHFRQDHFPCPHEKCLDQKFVVFESPLDLKGHMVSEHGEHMGKDEMRDARRVPVQLTIGRQLPNGQPDRTRRTNGTRRPERVAQPNTSTNTTMTLPRPTEDFPRLVAEQPKTDIEISPEHQALLAKVSAQLNHSPLLVQNFKATIAGYKSGEISIHHVLDTIWHMFTSKSNESNSLSDLDRMGAIFKAAIELLDNEEKKMEAISAWRDFRIEHTPFPTLPSTAQQSRGRMVTLGKGSAASSRSSTPGPSLPQPMRNTSQKANSVWNRVHIAATSGAHFVPNGVGGRPVVGTTAWSSGYQKAAAGPRTLDDSSAFPAIGASGSAAIAAAAAQHGIQPGPATKRTPIQFVKMLNADFPTLGGRDGAAPPKPRSDHTERRRGLADPTPYSDNVWTSKVTDASGTDNDAQLAAALAMADIDLNGRKKKKKGKELLFRSG